MVEKVHGAVSPTSVVGGKLNYYTVRTLLDIRPSATGDLKDEAQDRLNKLVEVISLRAQPMIIGGITVTSEAKASIADLPAAAAVQGTNVTVYTMKFVINHNQSWEVSGNNPTLVETLDGVAGFVYKYPTTDNNVAVTYSESL